MKQSFYGMAIKYLYYILFFVVPFVVFPFNSELFEFNKMLFIYTIASLILGAWMLRSFQEGKFFIRKSPLDIPLIFFLLSQVVSTLFSIDQHTSFFGYYGRFNGGLLSTLTYIFLYYAFISNVRSEGENSIRKILIISSLSSILVVLWGLPGTFNHDLSCLLFTSKFDNSCWTAQFRPAERMFSTLGQPNWLGAYLSITFFSSLYLFLTEKKEKIMLLSVLSMLFSFTGILLSRSRSSLGSIVPGTFLFGLYYLWIVIKKKNVFSPLQIRAAIGGGIILVMLIFIIKTGVPQVDSILSFSFLNKPIAQSIQSKPKGAQSVDSLTSGVSESFDIRKIVWEGALKLGNEYPLFGSGVETFGYAYYSVRPIAHNLTSEWDYLYNKAHNEYLNLFATTGWFGVLTFLYLCIVFFWVILQSLLKKHESLFFQLMIISIFLSIVITNFFGFSITVINIYWYFLFAVVVTHFYGKSENANFVLHKSSPTFAQSGTVLLVVLWLLNSIYSYWLADYKYAQADVALKNSNSTAAITIMQQALLLRDEHVYKDKLSYALAQYASTLAYQKKKEEMKQIMDLSESLNLQSLKDSPQSIIYWKTRVKNQFLFYQANLDKKHLFTGLSALEELNKLAPTDPKIPYFSSTYYSLLSDDEKNNKQKLLYQNKSLEEIDRTIYLKKNYGDAYFLKIQLLKKYGKKEEARSLLKFYITQFDPTNKELIKELEEM